MKPTQPFAVRYQATVVRRHGFGPYQIFDTAQEARARCNSCFIEMFKSHQIKPMPEWITDTLLVIPQQVLGDEDALRSFAAIDEVNEDGERIWQDPKDGQWYLLDSDDDSDN